ncbi:uncharacterized protein TRIADDRAFT_53818 [Trichoplax adhaerens]|uniref:Inward rectifier potassium channel C-terminal domain-containing protein n=1 Tax=Trichoplax adhaerens TaxID=10228 RepID=B3RQ90_TRIAD|nr:hypothetical protein TRIADDRAFT_53818 [Trichoplax adhaerens]EDV27783.1 hypothetical protein TRIADDRAFT_53818 [Trichoplax adhaerens]|eukprot:XP_002109617.1 hypothetical protein TRIADDRAFT_53818 [Trichoplax adhaerens]
MAFQNAQDIKNAAIQERRHSWPHQPRMMYPNFSSKNSSRFNSLSYLRRLFRRISRVIADTLMQPNLLCMTVNAIPWMIQSLYRWIKKCIIFLSLYLWDCVCLNYIRASERADLDGTSAMDDSLANRLKNVHFQNYQIRLDYDLYGNIVRMPWSYIFSLFAMIYLVTSIIFTFAYVCADLIDFELGYSCWHWLVFSLSTTTCLGSDSLDPDQAHLLLVLLANLQAFISQLLLASVTGIVFARFSRRRRQIQFADKLIINRINGVSYLQGRFTPIRPRYGVFNCIIQLYLTRSYHTEEGENGFSVHALPLACDTFPIVAMAVKFSHQLDDSSLLRQTLTNSSKDFGLIVCVMGADACNMNPVFDLIRYRREHIVKNARFANMVENIYSKDNKKDVYIFCDKLSQVILLKDYETEESSEGKEI